MIVDIGGGLQPYPRADYVIDLHHPRNSPPQDATQTPWVVGDDEGQETLLLSNPPQLHRSGASFLPDDSVDMIWTSHTLEHIPRGAPLIRLMNEAWRVLKPGGHLHATVPIVGWTDPTFPNDSVMKGRLVSDWRPYADPTHVSPWYLPQAVQYFTGEISPDADYGMSLWQPLGPYNPDPFMHPLGGWYVEGGWEGRFALVKPSSG